jgi:glycosyltransferase involved in cell wall biosynthesis
MRNADITFVVLTKDEAHNIEDCLRSLPDASRALVYDAMSSDSTVAMACSLGATVVQAPWDGYVRARAAAANLVSTPWTFMLDADERVTIALREELADLAPPDEATAYSVPRRNWFCGRWIRSAGWWPDRLVRLFRTGSAQVQGKSGEPAAAVHETWRTNGRCLELAEPIEHYSYRATRDYWRKFSRYTALEAQSSDGEGLGAVAQWLAVPLRFGWLMIGRGGIVEGWRGAFVCAGSAVYPAVVATKRYALHRSRPKGRLLVE